MPREPWYQRRDVPEFDPQAEPASMSEMLAQAPLPTDPLVEGYRRLGPQVEAVGGAPVGAADFMPPIPRDWKEAAVMGGMMAAPVMGQAAWKMRGVPRSTIESLKRGKGDPVNARIGARDEVYHATSPEGLEGILKSGGIYPEGRVPESGWKLTEPKSGAITFISESHGESVAQNYAKQIGASIEWVNSEPKPFINPFGPGDKGTSVTRTLARNNPSHVTKGNQPVVLVIDREKMPPNRPFAEAGYGKTTSPEMENAVYQNDELVGFNSPNPLFENESRTYNRSIPLSAVKEVIVNEKTLRPRGISESFSPDLQKWETRDLAQDTLNSIRSKAESLGIPVRTTPTNEALRTDRVRRFYRRANEATAGGSQ